jgi:hypothetical protein
MKEEFPWKDTERALANHYAIESYTQRMPTEHWRKILLADRDHVIYHGRMRQLLARSLGAGVVEVFKKPLDKEEQ